MLVVATVGAWLNAAIAISLVAIARDLWVTIVLFLILQRTENGVCLRGGMGSALGLARKVPNIVQIEEGGSAQFCSVVTNTWTCILAWSGGPLWNIFLMLTWTRMV